MSASIRLLIEGVGQLVISISIYGLSVEVEKQFVN